eukprot:1178137-Prorocentrum_minimum.AAC.3
MYLVSVPLQLLGVRLPLPTPLPLAAAAVGVPHAGHVAVVVRVAPARLRARRLLRGGGEEGVRRG